MPMDIINQAADNYRQSLQKQPTDPLAQLAAEVGLKINSPEAERKLRVMGQAIEQKAAQASQVRQADDIDKATTIWKQSHFTG